jgi:hypothetical protein
MAIYRFSAKVIKRSEGRSATAAAAYRAGVLLQDERLGEAWDYTRKRGILHSEIVAPDNAPEWMRDRTQLWNAVERVEKRRDAQLARDIVLALPCELTHTQRVDLVRSFVTDEFVSQGMIADFSMHAPDRGGDDRNHHSHVMLTMRNLTGEGFGNKNRNWNDTAQLEAWREHWANAVNRVLAQNGVAALVDHRSYVDQGINREAEPKQGPVATDMERNGRKSKAGDDRRAAQARNAARQALEQEAQALALEDAALREQQRKEEAEQARKDEAARVEQVRKDEERRREDETREQQRREETARAEQVRKDEDHRQAELREQQERKSLETLAAEQLARQTAMIDEMRLRDEEIQRQQQEIKAYLATQERQAKAEALRQMQQVVQAREGDITDSNARYAQALRHYDIRDPYASLARAAMSEHAMFRQQQQQLTKEIAGEQDDSKRRELELRKEIEGQDYMAITSKRLAGMSRVITGRNDSEPALREEERARGFAARAKELREERARLLEEHDRRREQEKPERGARVDDGVKRKQAEDAAPQGEMTDEKAARIAANQERAQKFNEGQKERADRSRHRGGRHSR